MSRANSPSMGSGPGSNAIREPFITIDDILVKAKELVHGLTKLVEYRHPLDIRRGVRRGVSKTRAERESVTIKASGRMYFLDVETTSEGKPYLKITESRSMGKDKDRERNTIFVFQENVEEFANAVSEMAAKIS